MRFPKFLALMGLLLLVGALYPSTPFLKMVAHSVVEITVVIITAPIIKEWHSCLL